MSSGKKKKKLYHLSKNRLPKNLRWMHDVDYLSQLGPEEKEWLNKFLKEYYDGNVKKGDMEALHNTTELRRDCYNRKNRQNRDLKSILDSGGKMDRVNETQVKKSSKGRKRLEEEENWD